MARKQLTIKGTEQKSIPEIERAAEHYVEVRDHRMELTEEEVEAKGALLAEMEKHKITTYRDDNAVPPLVIVVLPGESKVKVRRAEEQAEEVEADGE